MESRDYTINESTVQILRQRFRGALLRPDDDGYDEVRSIWNAMIDRKPALIAQPTGAADVMSAVNYARENDVLVSVKGGGHNVAGNAVCEGGLMIDLSELNDVRVDPGNKTARVGPGATLGDMDHETQVFDLATPGGIVSTTGVAGLTLGGGFGWLSRKYGLTIDNLRSVDIVTAAGELVHASEDENEDLFWGARGGGGNFGVVTSFEFQCHEVGPEVLFGPLVYPYEDAPDVLRTYRTFTQDAPRECMVLVNNLTAPPLPFIPTDYHGEKVIALFPFYAGDFEKGEEVLDPLRSFGDPIVDNVGQTPYTAVQSTFDTLKEKGARNYWRSHNLREFSGEAIDTLVKHVRNLRTPQSDVIIFHVGGAINEVSQDATAYPHRDAKWIVVDNTRWEDPTKDEEYIAWAREFFNEMPEYAMGGVYTNFISTGEQRVRAGYGDNYDRLVDLKKKYDPENLFRMNQNIDPSG